MTNVTDSSTSISRNEHWLVIWLIYFVISLGALSVGGVIVLSLIPVYLSAAGTNLANQNFPTERATIVYSLPNQINGSTITFQYGPVSTQQKMNFQQILNSQINNNLYSELISISVSDATVSTNTIYNRVKRQDSNGVDSVRLNKITTNSLNDTTNYLYVDINTVFKKDCLKYCRTHIMRSLLDVSLASIVIDAKSFLTIFAQPTTAITTIGSTLTTVYPTGETTSIVSGKEVYKTLIIDQIFPYSTSQKPIISANYSYPGPVIEANENDILVIHVINRLNVPTTVHWHGMRQLGTPDMDGSVGVTQCAIPPNYEITYRFKANPAGTTWYHGHLLDQYTDGLFGPLIIHKENEPNSQYYDSEQILTIADWYNNRANAQLLPWYLSPNNPNGNEPTPDAIVVNGKFTQSLFISLSKSTRVRFRVINTAAFSMFNVSIDGLPLHIIEVDSTATFPYKVSSFNINVAQRVSFYIDLSELDPTYTSSGASATSSVFIRIQAVVSMYPVDIVNYIPPYEQPRYPYPTFFQPLYLAFLLFNSSNSTPTYYASAPTPQLSNSSVPIDTNILAARPVDRSVNQIPNATHYLKLVIDFELTADGINLPFLNNVTYSSDANYMSMRPDPKTGITSDLYAPILQQMIEKSQSLGIPEPKMEPGNDLPTIQSDENGHYLVPYQAVVDIFLQNEDNGEHPFHLHGYNFWVIATSDYPQAEFLYANDYIQRDTISIPASGWAKIRFVADNPGAWFFHCHIEWHMSAGLVLVFVVSPQQLIMDGFTISNDQQSLCQALQQFNTNSTG